MPKLKVPGTRHKINITKKQQEKLSKILSRQLPKSLAEKESQLSNQSLTAEQRKKKLDRFKSQETTRITQKHVREFVIFKAQATFKGSKPKKNSPYQTASPFFSNEWLGRSIFSPNKKLSSLHRELSLILNDRHSNTGRIGDWRTTHAPQFGGFWSFKYERAIENSLGNKKSYIILESISQARE